MTQEKNNIVIPLNDQSEAVLFKIIKKYNLEEAEEEAFKKTAQEKPLNDAVVIQLTRDLMLEKISNMEFVEALHKGLGTDKGTTKNLAVDIVTNLIPMLEKIPEDKLREYNRKKELVEQPVEQEKTEEKSKEEMAEAEKKEAFSKAKEELLKKIGANTHISEPEPAKTTPVPYDKKIEITDVEDNAENMEREGKNITKKPETGESTPQPIKPATDNAPKDPFANEKKGPDDYREPIE